MTAYKIYENNIIFSVSENVMHHFRKSKFYTFSLEICVFQCPNSICIHNKISCACQILSIPNLFPNIEQRLLFKMVPNTNVLIGYWNIGPCYVLFKCPSYFASFKMISSKSDFINILMILYMYIGPGQGQKTPWGQTFDVNRNPLSLCPFIANNIQKWVPLRAMKTFIRKKMGHTT